MGEEHGKKFDERADTLISKKLMFDMCKEGAFDA